MSELPDETPPMEHTPEQANASTEPSPELEQDDIEQVKGRIEIHDEVVEKVAGLAATEVEGVADLGGNLERAVESVRERIGVGRRRGDQGVTAEINGREVSIEVTVVVEYGFIVMDVARQVQTNVAAQTNRMLGLRVVEVNVTVDDVRLPATPNTAPVEGDDQHITIGD